MLQPVHAVHLGLVKGPSPILCSSIALPDGGVPDWVHLLPAGAVRTIDGRGPYTVRDATALMAVSLGGGKLTLDENHATDLAAPKGDPAPARWWIAELQSRADGIWGRVEWTGPGRQIMENKEYRGVSPVILHAKDGAITAILRASLTNTPNLTGLTALHSQETTMDLRTMLIEAMGLASDADDAAILAACKAMMKDEAAEPDAAAMQSALAPIGALVGLPATADAAAVLVGVQRLKAGGTEGAAVVALQAELVGVTNRLNAVTDQQLRDKATAFVDGAIAQGRVGVKPMRDEYISMHMAEAVRTEKLIGAMPAIKAGSTFTGQPVASTDGLGEAEVQVIALMGLDRAAYAASHAETRQEAL